MEALFQKSVDDVRGFFGLSDESLSLLEDVDRAAEELALPEFEHYLERRFDEQIPIILSRYNLTGIPISKEYGGRGAGMLTYCLALQRIGQLGMSPVSFISVHTGLGGFSIEQYGSKEQKDAILPHATKGKKVIAFALTEPNVGSDPSSLEMSYEKKGTSYMLNGEKYLITNAGIATIILVFARSKESGRISCFLVDTNSEGFNLEMELKEKMGLFTSNTAMFSLKDYIASTNDLLGPEGRGLSMAYSSLMNGRLGVASGCLGVIDDCMNSVLERSRSRTQHGKQIGKHQLIQQHISAIAMNREMARWPTYRASVEKERYNKNPESRTVRMEADHQIALAKRIASKCAFDSADRAVQVFGGFGYSILSNPGRHFCDIRVTRLYEGTDEIMDLKIGSYLLGEGFEAYK